MEFLYRRKTRHATHILMVQGMEHDLPVKHMPGTDHADIYVEAKGRWVDGEDAKVAGFSIAKTLEKTYGRIEMESEQREDGKMVLVPKSRLLLPSGSGSTATTCTASSKAL